MAGCGAKGGFIDRGNNKASCIYFEYIDSIVALPCILRDNTSMASLEEKLAQKTQEIERIKREEREKTLALEKQKE